jgi:hypothetical protein
VTDATRDSAHSGLSPETVPVHDSVSVHDDESYRTGLYFEVHPAAA